MRHMVCWLHGGHGTWHDIRQASKLLGFAMTHVACCSWEPSGSTSDMRSFTHLYTQGATWLQSLFAKIALLTKAYSAVLLRRSKLCICNHADHIKIYASLGIRQEQQSTSLAAALQQISRQVRSCVGKLLPVLKFAAGLQSMLHDLQL